MLRSIGLTQTHMECRNLENSVLGLVSARYEIRIFDFTAFMSR